jgi:hypothetical protein
MCLRAPSFFISLLSKRLEPLGRAVGQRRCDNSRTYLPEVRQYYGLVLLCFQPSTTLVRETLVICVLTFCWYHMTFPSPRYLTLPSPRYLSLRCLGMKHDWTDGTKKRWSRLFVYANGPIPN